MAHSHSVTEYPKQLTGVMLLSAAVGAMAVLLFTPRRGKEVRGNIRHRLLVLRNDSANTIDIAKDKVKSSAHKAREDATQTAKDVKSDARETAEDAKDMADRVRRNGEP